jgi:arylformamidase
VIIDISLSIGADTPVWPGDPPVSVEPVARLEAGDVAGVSRLVLGTHTGTHVDPPAHFLPGGVAVDELPLDVLVGAAVVADVTGGGPIDAGRLEALGLPGGTTRILLKTADGKAADGKPAVGGRAPAPARGLPSTGFVTPDGARWLVDHGVRLVGVDTLSIEPATADYPVHRLLLGAGVIIVEGLDLTAAPAGRYQLVCLPLRIAGGDGAPARAVLVPLADPS